MRSLPVELCVGIDQKKLNGFSIVLHSRARYHANGQHISPYLLAAKAPPYKNVLKLILRLFKKIRIYNNNFTSIIDI